MKMKLLILTGIAFVSFVGISGAQGNRQDSDPRPKMGLLRHVAASKDGKLAIAGDSERNIWVWSAKTRQVVAVISHPFASYDTAPCYAFSQDGRYALVGNGDGRYIPGKPINEREKEILTLWDLQQAKKLRAFELSGEPVIHVSLSPDAKTAISISISKRLPRQPVLDSGLFNTISLYSLKMWDTSNGKLIRTLIEGAVNCPTVSWTASREISEIWVDQGSLENRKSEWGIRQWGGPAAELISDRKHQCDKNIVATSVAFSPDGKVFAIAGGTTVSLWKRQSGELIWSCNYSDDCKRVKDRAFLGHWYFDNIAFSPDAKKIVASGPGFRGLLGTNPSGSEGVGGVLVLDAANGRKTPGFRPINQLVGCVSFTTDGRSLIGATFNGMQHWDSSTGTSLFTLHD
jgi:WD40 repeat protein